MYFLEHIYTWLPGNALRLTPTLSAPDTKRTRRATSSLQALCDHCTTIASFTVSASSFTIDIYALQINYATMHVPRFYSTRFSSANCTGNGEGKKVKT
jgi:hypothetical protein